MSKREVELIKNVAKLFEIGSTKSITKVSSFEPSPTTHAVTFSLKDRTYLIYLNSDLMNTGKQIVQSLPSEYNKGFRAIKNPDKSGYSIRYKGKNVYLLATESTLERFDSALSRQYPEMSRSTIQKYIKKGRARVNNITVTTPSKLVRASDTLGLTKADTSTISAPKFKVIYSDENVIVIDKPAGILSHSKGALNDEYTVADFFKKYSSYNRQTNRPGIIHRLDRDTSGVMLGALNEETAKFIQKQFSNRTVKKSYYAIVKGRPKLDRALLDLPIERNPSKPSTFRVGAKGKSAQTEYKVIDSSGAYSLILLEPKTGRTHQLRVHMAHIGNPIIGDRVYGTPSDRLYLHAARLELTLPGGVRKVFESKLPKQFNELLET